MSKILKLVPKVINGLTFGMYEMAGMIYRAEPIKQRQQLIIPNLGLDKVTTIDLEGELNYDLLITGVDMDVRDDDNQEFKSGQQQDEFPSASVLKVGIINRKTNKVVKKLAFQITAYPNFTNELIISPEFIYQLKPNRYINTITFTGEPVYLKAPIVFVNGVES